MNSAATRLIIGTLYAANQHTANQHTANRYTANRYGANRHAANLSATNFRLRTLGISIGKRPNIHLSLQMWELQVFYAAGAMDRCAACWIKRFITLAHMTFLRTALSLTLRPWANMLSSAFIFSTRRIACSLELAP
jgi:hypothetical protein